MTTRTAAAALISDDYRRMQEELHRNPKYGMASVAYAPLVADVIRAKGFTEILDYGAGKGRLGETLKGLVTTPLAIRHYDPAVPAWSAPPEPCELVACIDVLEHVEPELLDNVLDDLRRVTARYGVYAIATGPARKVLSDGRNAHLTQQPAKWWLPKIMERFELVAYNRNNTGFWLVVEAPGH